MIFKCVFNVFNSYVITISYIPNLQCIYVNG